MTQSGKNKKISLDNIAESLDLGLSGVDSERKAKLDQLNSVRSIKAKQLQREKERLSKKYGENHPRVQVINTKIESNNVLIKGIEISASNAEVEVPGVNEKAWILHGFVKDNNLNPMRDITVAIYDEEGNWMKAIGYACTDAKGYFRIDYYAEKVRKVNTAELDSVRLEVSQQNAYYIHLSDKKGNQIYVDKRPLYPKLGQVDYRLIIIDKDAANCVPPDEKKREKPVKKESPQDTGLKNKNSKKKI